MRSTGEVMGIDTTFGLAFAKSQMAAGNRLPESGSVFFSLADRDKLQGLAAALRFVELGFTIAATAGHRGRISRSNGVPVETVVAKVGEESPERANAVELIATRQGAARRQHAARPWSRAPTVRTSAGRPTCTRLPCLTTVAAARAAAAGIADRGRHAVRPQSPGVPRRRPGAHWRCEPRVAGLTS